ncbi:MAG: hypothetical protein ACREKE_05605 [bacterium]
MTTPTLLASFFFAALVGIALHALGRRHRRESERLAMVHSAARWLLHYPPLDY